MTRETQEHIQFLLIQYLDGNALPEELDRLSAYLLSASEEGVWVEMMEELMVTEPALSGYDPVAWQPFVEELKQKNAAFASSAKDAGNSSAEAVVRPVRFLRRYQWWAAAAILLLFGSGVWWFRQNRESSQAVSQQVPPGKDLLPGGNRATLTLAGGKQINLDSASNGLLTVQGNVRVQKLANGRLAYQHFHEQSTEVLYNTLSTPRGGQYQLTLPDGSQVWLNAASSITYPTTFTAATRTVKITGEAYFEVVHNQRQPFRVQAGDQLIEDIGTSFNVNAYADEPLVNTTLVTGKVNVSRGTDMFVLSPGQQAQSGAGGFKTISNADIELALAWKNGVFAFRDADLSTVMRQLSRWYDIDVEFEGTVPTGVFDGEIGRNLTLNQVLNGLANARIHYTIVNNHKIIVRP